MELMTVPVEVTNRNASFLPNLFVQVTCNEDEFHCSSEFRCITSSWKCDGDKDCSDGEDERDCEPRDCMNGEWFNCTTPIACIPPGWVCDGDEDCADGTDELNCPTQTTSTTTMPSIILFLNYTVPAINGTCGNKLYLCESTQECIAAAWQCDGDVDCPNGEDENNCSNSQFSTATLSPHAVPNSLVEENRFCPDGKIKCLSSRECILPHWVCDGDKDCSDNSDELNCPFLGVFPGHKDEAVGLPPRAHGILGSSRNNSKLDLPRGRDSTRIIHPKPEKEKPGRCNNEPGYFQCENSLKCIDAARVCNGVRDCLDGSDESIGCSKHKEGFLLVSLGKRLEAFSLDVKSSFRVHLDRLGQGNIIGVSYDPVLKEVYWSNSSRSGGGVFKAPLSGNNNPTLVFASGIVEQRRQFYRFTCICCCRQVCLYLFVEWERPVSDLFYLALKGVFVIVSILYVMLYTCCILSKMLSNCMYDKMPFILIISLRSYPGMELDYFSLYYVVID
ncbi:hypothetical protein SK128_018106 [Halocaridina rubra]|uniref:Uncharacterized protein n=1 Tax=Halocaridina rubra TaxID=373956 RepID=A0AAN8WFT1_HALRR